MLNAEMRVSIRRERQRKGRFDGSMRAGRTRTFVTARRQLVTLQRRVERR
jgi:hypothetical protein